MEASKMTFEEWMRAKEEEERKATHGAEVVSFQKYGNLYYLQSAILSVCFENRLFFHNLYFIPPVLDKGSLGLYGYQRIMISKPYYEKHGIDDDTTSTMFHELVHAWDAIKGIKDTDGDYHNTAFKKTCEEHGGVCFFRNQKDGFNDARPDEKSMKQIKAEIKRRMSG